MIRALGAATPSVHPSAFIHDASEIVGRVSIGRDASVWPGAVLRADVCRITIGERTNIQDGAVLHGREGFPAALGRGVTVGHGAIVHGARVGDGCLIGMGAIVMEALVGAESLVAAGALVLSGMKIPPRSLVIGSPARVARALTARERAGLKRSAESYVKLARRHASRSRVVFER